MLPWPHCLGLGVRQRQQAWGRRVHEVLRPAGGSPALPPAQRPAWRPHAHTQHQHFHTTAARGSPSGGATEIPARQPQPLGSTAQPPATAGLWWHGHKPQTAAGLEWPKGGSGPQAAAAFVHPQASCALPQPQPKPEWRDPGCCSERKEQKYR